MRLFEYATHATLGKRLRQEDSLLLWSGNIPVVSEAEEKKSLELLAILADGMGGHVGGSTASQIVCQAFAQAFARGEGDVPSRLNFALHSANQKIIQTITQNPKLLGMGSTLLGVFFLKNFLYWISVGDSLLYLFRNGKITILNEDHSMAQLIDREAAERGPNISRKGQEACRNMLRSAVTGGEISLIDLLYCPLQLEDTDYIILATDGILSLSLTEIEKKLCLTHHLGPQCVARSIVEGVEDLKDPYQDNTTVIAVRHIAKQ